MLPKQGKCVLSKENDLYACREVKSRSLGKEDVSQACREVKEVARQ